MFILQFSYIINIKTLSSPCRYNYQGGYSLMKFYETSIKAMEKVLRDTKEDFYADYIKECIQKWESSKDTSYFTKGFSKKGRFENFTFQTTEFSSEENRYWTQQYFGGLVAMAMQLAKFITEGKTIDIGFIKKNFGITFLSISQSGLPLCDNVFI